MRRKGNPLGETLGSLPKTKFAGQAPYHFSNNTKLAQFNLNQLL
jgi:hypothetical protein